MLKRVVKILIVLVIAYYGYQFLGTALNAHRADISLWSAWNKAESCEQEPTSQCFAEMAVLSLGLHNSLSGVGGVDLELRYVGYGDFADAVIKPDDRRWIESNRISQKLYESVSTDTEQFIAAPPTDDVHAYLAAYAFLQDDTSYFSTSFPVGDAVDSARSRRGPPDITSRTAAFLEKWRQSLDQHGRYSTEWLYYATRARELKKLDEAKEALEKAEEIGFSGTNRVAAMVETWRLFGEDAVAKRIEESPDTNFRAEAYLKLSDLSLGIGDNAWSSRMFASFVENYDREKPIHHRVVWIHMASRAARVAHAMGDNEQAEVWADAYAKETSFYSVPERVRYSGRLYADIGLFEKATAIAREAIVHAPAPKKPFWSVLRGQKVSGDTAVHNSIVGHAVGIFCQAGEFETAFAFADNNPGYGADASVGCLAAIQGGNTPLQLAEVEKRLGHSSKRPLRTGYAAMLVERGDYKQAVEFIENTLDLPPRFSQSTRAIENVQLLRLAVAMRNEPLTRMIMRHIARDASEVSGNQAMRLFATVASHTKAWPED